MNNRVIFFHARDSRHGVSSYYAGQGMDLYPYSAEALAPEQLSEDLQLDPEKNFFKKRRGLILVVDRQQNELSYLSSQPGTDTTYANVYLKEPPQEGRAVFELLPDGYQEHPLETVNTSLQLSPGSRLVVPVDIKAQAALLGLLAAAHECSSDYKDLVWSTIRAPSLETRLTLIEQAAGLPAARRRDAEGGPPAWIQGVNWALKSTAVALAGLTLLAVLFGWRFGGTGPKAADNPAPNPAQETVPGATSTDERRVVTAPILVKELVEQAEALRDQDAFDLIWQGHDDARASFVAKLWLLMVPDLGRPIPTEALIGTDTHEATARLFAQLRENAKEDGTSPQDDYLAMLTYLECQLKPGAVSFTKDKSGQDADEQPASACQQIARDPRVMEQLQILLDALVEKTATLPAANLHSSPSGEDDGKATP